MHGTGKLMLTFPLDRHCPVSKRLALRLSLAGQAGWKPNQDNNLIKTGNNPPGPVSSGFTASIPENRLLEERTVLTFNFDKEIFMAYPLLSSLFVMDFTLLMCATYIKFPVILGIALVCGLVYLSMFFGVKLNETQAAK